MNEEDVEAYFDAAHRRQILWGFLWPLTFAPGIAGLMGYWSLAAALTFILVVYCVGVPLIRRIFRERAVALKIVLSGFGGFLGVGLVYRFSPNWALPALALFVPLYVIVTVRPLKDIQREYLSRGKTSNSA